MLLSKLFSKPSKDASADNSSANADLLTRAGFIAKSMAGVYSYLPLGLRVLRKIEDILREEMDNIGFEVFLPALSPRENWEKTGRLDSVGVLFGAHPANAVSKKNHDVEYVLNSTHEEVITPLVQSYVKSYKDLPCAAYQIQTKFRNEARAKSGILRGREFRMKDLYSFHTSEADMLDYFYNKAIPAYSSYFNRIGLGDKTVITLASGGDFSKEYSREFQTRCSVGEDQIFHVPGSETYYNREIAPSRAPAWGDPKEPQKDRKDVEGKGIIGVEALAKFLGIEVERTTKTMLFETNDGSVVAAAVRGDYDVHEEKLKKILECKSLTLASAETVKRVTGAEVGYAGPIGLPKDVRVVWDDATKGRKNFECGANETNMHTINANFSRDIAEPAEFYDIKVAREGDIHPESNQAYEVFRACEVGNVFTLYTKFSSAFDFTVQDADGKEQPVYMGCYGLGTTRVMGVLAEVFHDERGLTWPKNVAPAEFHIIPLAKTTSDPAYKESWNLYEALQKAKKECIFDDRIDSSTGSRLADADLIGVPLRIIVSEKSLKNGGIEVKERTAKEAKIIAAETWLQEMI